MKHPLRTMFALLVTVVDPMPTYAETQRITLPIPPEAYRPALPEPEAPVAPMVPTVSIFDRRRGSRPAPTSFVDAAAAAGGASVLGWRATGSGAQGRLAQLDRAVEFFDRGLELRGAGRYGEALDAWERALALAPSNHLYQSHVRRLRLQLHALRTGGPPI